MKVKEIAKLVDGEIVGAPVDETYEVKKAFASDLMSDVLRFHMDDTVLITGLCNNQTMRTSEMADLRVVLIGRDKQPDEDMRRDSAALLAMHYTFNIERGNFTDAGQASSSVKRTLKQLGVDPANIKRTVVALFEAEINAVAHAYGGTIDVDIDGEKIVMVVADQGPGIPNLDLAMQEGWSTASPKVREMGYGAGMGLPNIKKNTDDLKIDTEVGVGTTVTMTVYLV